jgi:hypothetical protein
MPKERQRLIRLSFRKRDRDRVRLMINVAQEIEAACIMKGDHPGAERERETISGLKAELNRLEAEIALLEHPPTQP